MKLFNLKINADRRYPSEPENLDRSIIETLQSKGVSTKGAVVTLNSIIIDTNDYKSTFADMGVKEDDLCTVNVVVKTSAA